MNFELEEISDWKKLRKKLNNNYEFNSNWELAINLFKQRIGI